MFDDPEELLDGITSLVEEVQSSESAPRFQPLDREGQMAFGEQWRVLS
jgi:hypothetical protein